MDTKRLRLYLVTDRPMLPDGRSLEAAVEAAVRGGVTMVQLREKNAPAREVVALGRALHARLAPWGVPLIVNDRVDVALAVGAEGVHIGQNDLPYTDARRLLGPGKILGLSVETYAQAEAANAQAVDYVAASPVYYTPTKGALGQGLGIEGLREIVRISRHPVVGIGGMKPLAAEAVAAAGACGMAVVSYIMAAADPAEAAGELRRAWKQAVAPS
jgi:thiamine-phosphate pyrophosphorylase